jgi:hypothetical protein
LKSSPARAKPLRPQLGRCARRVLVAALLLGVARARAAEGTAVRGIVVDLRDSRPISGAILTLGEALATSGADGRFTVAGAGDRLRARAAGHARLDLALPSSGSRDEIRVSLAPLRPKALYLSVYGIGDPLLRESALALIDGTELNALVIDVKGDNGKIPYASSLRLPAAIGAQHPTTIRDPEALLARLHRQGVYTIARIVVFKDRPLALARPDLAAKTRGGAVWTDREGLAWTDPFRREVWDYNVDVALEAARLGFDEIQFDYVRFPDEPGLLYAEPNTERARIGAIGGFLREARRRLVPYNVFLSADVFGYVCWNRNDTMIGQRLEELAPLLDVISPMLYPSSFQFGIPAYRQPVEHPYEIVHRSLDEAQRRTGLAAERFRPWLQAFRDYGFDRRPFSAKEIRAQIDAAEEFGSGGWMLWNPHNTYSDQGLAR